jgi:hypothetical protein
MINAGKLLADLKRLRRGLDADLRATHAVGAQRDAVQAEWREAFDLGRTRDTFEAFLDGAFDQAVVHWVLGCVFLRFLEDNLLVDRPFLSGPGERLDLAKKRQEAHFRALPHDSDTEYLIATFGEAARLPGMAGLFDPAHNPLFRLALSGDGAMALIRFFREVPPETGELAHNFTDPDWNTRFLGDLYQDLSEEARKRYALLQTPDFVESWILDRTLDPAIREFGHERVTMIDPACGSGHFLLGGFARLLREWQRLAPGLPPAEQAQRALDAIAGVDLNPFAVEIARFRLLVTALKAADVRQLKATPGFQLNFAAGIACCTGDISSCMNWEEPMRAFAVSCAITMSQKIPRKQTAYLTGSTTLSSAIPLTSRQKIPLCEMHTERSIQVAIEPTHSAPHSSSDSSTLRDPALRRPMRGLLDSLLLTAL